MNMDRKMIDSGIEWIGAIPENWTATDFKNRANIHLGKMLTPDEKTNSILTYYFRSANITGNSNNLKKMYATPSEIRKNSVQKGDILISEGGTIGAPKMLLKDEIPKDGAIIQNSVHRVRFHENQRYGYWICLAAYNSGSYNLEANSVSILHLTKEKLLKFKIPAPPLPEQEAIASFLDHHVNLIDRERELVAKKIELLKEKRKALVFECVTGKRAVVKRQYLTKNAIDCNDVVGHGEYVAIPQHFVKNGGLIDSGVEWIGEIPDGWELARAADALNLIPTHKEIKGKLYQSPQKNLFPAYSASGQDVWSKKYDFKTPGIVLSAVGARCGKCFLADGFWSATANTHVFFSKTNTDLRYIWYIVNDENWWIRGGTAQPFVQTPASLRQKIPKPLYPEQQLISTFLDKQTTLIDKEINLLNKKISLLSEKKKSLIFEAVTGKLQVTNGE